MEYTIQKLAKLAGVSVRTLHHYDQISLFKPSRVGDNGYRYYGKPELLRLQQILFFRELRFSLETIRAVLERPDYHERTCREFSILDWTSGDIKRRASIRPSGVLKKSLNIITFLNTSPVWNCWRILID